MTIDIIRKPFPRYSRAESLNCKLSEVQIDEIKKLHQLGWTSREIGAKFNVRHSTILYWLKPKEDQIKHNKRTNSTWKKYYYAKSKEQRREKKKKYLKRKILLKGKEYWRYLWTTPAITRMRQTEQFKIKQSIIRKRYYQNHREEQIARHVISNRKYLLKKKLLMSH